MGTAFRAIAWAGMVAAAISTGGGGAWAAPQALALVSTGGGIELTCRGDACFADFTTFCLQKDRVSPPSGTAYRLAGGDIRVLGTTPDGASVSLDPRLSLTFGSRREHFAVRLSMAGSERNRLGLTKVTVSVGENVAILPVAVPGDPNPHTEAEIALLVGSLRPVGSALVDANHDNMVAARITNRIINGLPEDGWTSDRTRRRLLEGALDGAGGALAPEAKDRVRGVFELCNWSLNTAALTSMRRCLEGHHDIFVRYLNTKYWNALKVGS